MSDLSLVNFSRLAVIMRGKGNVLKYESEGSDWLSILKTTAFEELTALVPPPPVKKSGASNVVSMQTNTC